VKQTSDESRINVAHQREVRELRGKLRWEGDLEEMRRNKPAPRG
jgi:hypothetical protein